VEFSIKVTSLVCAALRLTVDYVIVYIADTGCQIRQHGCRRIHIATTKCNYKSGNQICS